MSYYELNGNIYSYDMFMKRVEVLYKRAIERSNKIFELNKKIEDLEQTNKDLRNIINSNTCTLHGLTLIGGPNKISNEVEKFEHKVSELTKIIQTKWIKSKPERNHVESIPGSFRSPRINLGLAFYNNNLMIHDGYFHARLDDCVYADSCISKVWHKFPEVKMELL